MISNNKLQGAPSISTYSIDATKNDYGPMPIDTVLSATHARKGLVSLSNNNLQYTPFSGSQGLDTIDYQIAVGGNPPTAEQTIVVLANSNQLIGQPDFCRVKQNDSVLIDYASNDYYPYGVVSTLKPLLSNGAIRFVNNKICYKANPFFNGIDSFQYSIKSTIAPYDSVNVWVYVVVCPNIDPMISSSVPIIGGFQLSIITSNTLQLPLYYGIINDTNNRAAGYSANYNVNSYAHTMFWNTPNTNGTFTGCIYVTDKIGCSSRSCLTSTINHCNPPPSAIFTSSLDTVLNFLAIDAATKNLGTQHFWELSYNSSLINNPIFSSNQATDTITNLLLCGDYLLTHITCDNSKLCTDTAVYSFKINSLAADTFSGYAFTDLNLDGLFKQEPPAPKGSLVWVANAQQALYAIHPDTTGYFSFTLKSDSFIFGITPSQINTIQTIPIRPMNYHTPKGNGKWHVGGLLFGLHPAAYHIHGRLYVDLNGNNTIDIGEPLIKNHSISIKNKLLLSDNKGVYHYFTSSTNPFIISPSTIPFYNTNNQTIQPLAGIADYPVDISFIPKNKCFSNGTILITADEDTIYNSSRTYVHVLNYGTQGLTGTITLKYPDSIKIRFCSDSGSVDSIQHIIRWKIKNPIICSQQSAMHICWNCNNPSRLLNFEASLQLDTSLVDIDITDNQDTLEIVAMSPNFNSKWASPYGKGSAHDIAPWQNIRYGICVRNPLSQPTINITILDTLDKDLNFRSWQFLNSSYPPSSVSFENGVANITYNDCFQLPGSNGSIETTFKVSPWPGLPMHKQIRNNASIYWDNQQHTHTNTVFHTIEYFLGIENKATSYQISIYPNPVSTQGEIQVASDITISSIRIFSMSGSYLGEESVMNGIVHLSKSKLKPGSYLIELCQEGKVLATKTLILE